MESMTNAKTKRVQFVLDEANRRSPQKTKAEWKEYCRARRIEWQREKKRLKQKADEDEDDESFFDIPVIPLPVLDVSTSPVLVPPTVETAYASQQDARSTRVQSMPLGGMSHGYSRSTRHLAAANQKANQPIIRARIQGTSIVPVKTITAAEFLLRKRQREETNANTKEETDEEVEKDKKKRRLFLSWSSDHCMDQGIIV